MDQVSLSNMALGQIRARTSITSIDPSDGSKAADTISLYFWPVIDGIARSAHWNCLRFQQPLTLLKAAQGTPENPNGTTPTPPPPWLYEYGWPSQPYCLRPRFIIPPINPAQGIPFLTNQGIVQPPFTTKNAVVFIVAADTDQDGNLVKVILTNIQQPQLVYTARIEDPDLWDASYQNAVVYALASWIEEPLTGSKDLRAATVQLAGGFIQSARVSDGNEGPTSVDNLPDFIRVRSGAPNWAPAFAIGWENYSFPGGTII